MSAAVSEASPARPAKVSFDETVAIIARQAVLLAPERRALPEALGAVLADDAVALAPHPAFDMSAMDGFAAPTALTLAATPTAPVRLPVVGTPFAGHAQTSDDTRAAYAFTTGAPIPRGCDAVLVSENAIRSADGRWLPVSEPLRPGANIRQEGGDGRPGERLLAAGSRVDAAAIGALACFGVRDVAVRRTPTFAVLSTGDELSCAGPGAIFDSNGPMIAAQAQDAGARVQRGPALPDRPRDVAEALRRLVAEGRPDVIVTTGGVSVGARDCIPEALTALGARVWFHGVAMRPGKPVLFATLPGGTLFFGLPGNPVAAFLGFRFFVTAALGAMRGEPMEAGRPVASEIEVLPGATTFHKVRADGMGAIEFLAGQQSHRIRPLLAANTWLAVGPEGARLFALGVPHARA